MPDSEAREERHWQTNWERQEALVLKTLTDLRLSADAGLKLSGEVDRKLTRLEAQFEAHVEQSETRAAELKARMDKAMAALSTLVIGVGMFLLQQILSAVIPGK